MRGVRVRRRRHALRFPSGATLTAVVAAAAAIGGHPFLAAVHAQVPRSATAPRPEIIECWVYSDTDPTKRHDCTARARELCSTSAGTCELPIGLALSDGRDLDEDRETWEKVRVTFRCGELRRVNGPHHQNDHATAVLTCGSF